jgi:hypothetical protein
MTGDADESHALRGTSDSRALRAVRRVFDTQEPLATEEFDNVVNPQVLELQFSDGVGAADSARIDVRWSTQNDYNIHYTDRTGRHLRWDRHPHEFPTPTGDAHFHPPPDASTAPGDVECSCIDETRVDIVARAIHKLWRRVYEQGSFEDVNTAANPP